jgi:hypothetical protein
MLDEGNFNWEVDEGYMFSRPAEGNMFSIKLDEGNTLIR